MMKILYHHRTMGRGAEGVHIVNMVKAFEGLGNDVKIISPPSVDPLKEAGRSVFQVEKTNLKRMNFLWRYLNLSIRKFPQIAFEIIECFYNFYALYAILLSTKHYKPDLFYERYAFFSFIGGMIAKRKGIPYILEVNEISGLKRFRKQCAIKCAGWIEKKIFQNTDLIIVVSSFLKKKIVNNGIPREKIMVLPNGVNIEEFSIKINSCHIRNQYGIALDDVVIGFVGWFAEWDRLDKLIEVFNLLCGASVNIKLMLVGDGSIKPQLHQTVKDMNITEKVIITGAIPREEIQKYISTIDIFVLPHSNEFGSPIVLFEVMAMGKPVVAPALGPINDVIENNSTGLIFPPEDFTAMEVALLRLIKDRNLRIKLGNSARSEIINKHTWRKKAENILQIINSQRFRKVVVA